MENVIFLQKNVNKCADVQVNRTTYGTGLHVSEQVTRLQCGNEGCTVLHPAGFASASLKHSGHLKAATQLEESKFSRKTWRSKGVL